MFHTLILHLEPILRMYGALGVFVAAVIEEIFAPIPSTLVVFTASMLMTRGMHGAHAYQIIALKIMLPASLGLAIGSLVPFFVARIGERVAINRFGKFLGI